MSADYAAYSSSAPAGSASASASGASSAYEEYAQIVSADDAPLTQVKASSYDAVDDTTQDAATGYNVYSSLQQGERGYNSYAGYDSVDELAQGVDQVQLTATASSSSTTTVAPAGDLHEDEVRLLSLHQATYHRLLHEYTLPWHEYFQRILEQPRHSLQAAARALGLLNGILLKFTHVAEQLVKIIVSESNLPLVHKTVKPVDVGGVAGGEKFFACNLFFKRVNDAHQIYGSELGAMKAAGHEINGLKAVLAYTLKYLSKFDVQELNHRLFTLKEKILRAPLMILVDFAGYRMLVSSLLPLNKQSLSYGSANAGVTVHKHLAIHDMMKAVGTALNLKEHVVGQPQQDGTLQSIVGPCDIEVHIGTDQEYYILDTARIFPPQVPNRMIHAVFLHENAKVPIRNVTLTKHSFTRILFELLFKETVKDVKSVNNNRIVMRRVDDIYFYYINPREVSNQSVLAGCSKNTRASKVLQFYTSSEVVESTSQQSTSPQYDLSGPVVISTGISGVHLYELLRPELLLNPAACPTPLSSDAFTGFGRHDSAVHNAEVARAFEYMLTIISPRVALDLIQRTTPTFSMQELTSLFHKYGLNMRFLPHVRKHIPDKFERERSFLLTAMVTRFIKQDIRKKLRLFSQAQTQTKNGGRSIRVMSDEYRIKLVVSYFNIIFGTGIGYDSRSQNQQDIYTNATEYFWRVHVYLGLHLKFGSVYDENDGLAALNQDLRPFVQQQLLFAAVQEATGVWFAPAASQRFLVQLDQAGMSQVDLVKQPQAVVQLTSGNKSNTDANSGNAEKVPFTLSDVLSELQCHTRSVIDPSQELVTVLSALIQEEFKADPGLTILPTVESLARARRYAHLICSYYPNTHPVVAGVAMRLSRAKLGLALRLQNKVQFMAIPVSHLPTANANQVVKEAAKEVKETVKQAADKGAQLLKSGFGFLKKKLGKEESAPAPAAGGASSSNIPVAQPASAAAPVATPVAAPATAVVASPVGTATPVAAPTAVAPKSGLDLMSLLAECTVPAWVDEPVDETNVAALYASSLRNFDLANDMLKTLTDGPVRIALAFLRGRIAEGQEKLDEAFQWYNLSLQECFRWYGPLHANYFLPLPSTEDIQAYKVSLYERVLVEVTFLEEEKYQLQHRVNKNLPRFTGAELSNDAVWNDILKTCERQASALVHQNIQELLNKQAASQNEAIKQQQSGEQSAQVLSGTLSAMQSAAAVSGMYQLSISRGHPFLNIIVNRLCHTIPQSSTTWLLTHVSRAVNSFPIPEDALLKHLLFEEQLPRSMSYLAEYLTLAQKAPIDPTQYLLQLKSNERLERLMLGLKESVADEMAGKLSPEVAAASAATFKRSVSQEEFVLLAQQLDMSFGLLCKKFIYGLHEIPMSIKTVPQSKNSQVEIKPLQPTVVALPTANTNSSSSSSSDAAQNNAIILQSERYSYLCKLPCSHCSSAAAGVMKWCVHGADLWATWPIGSWVRKRTDIAITTPTGKAHMVQHELQVYLGCTPDPATGQLKIRFAKETSIEGRGAPQWAQSDTFVPLPSSYFTQREKYVQSTTAITKQTPLTELKWERDDIQLSTTKIACGKVRMANTGMMTENGLAWFPLLYNPQTQQWVLNSYIDDSLQRDCSIRAPGAPGQFVEMDMTDMITQLEYPSVPIWIHKDSPIHPKRIIPGWTPQMIPCTASSPEPSPSASTPPFLGAELIYYPGALHENTCRSNIQGPSAVSKMFNVRCTWLPSGELVCINESKLPTHVQHLTQRVVQLGVMNPQELQANVLSRFQQQQQPNVFSFGGLKFQIGRK